MSAYMHHHLLYIYGIIYAIVAQNQRREDAFIDAMAHWCFGHVDMADMLNDLGVASEFHAKLQRFNRNFQGLQGQPPEGQRVYQGAISSRDAAQEEFVQDNIQ